MQNKGAVRIKCSNKGRASWTETGWKSKERHSQGEESLVQGWAQENRNSRTPLKPLMWPGHRYTSSDWTSNPENWPAVALTLQSSLYVPAHRIQSSPFIPTCVWAQLFSCVWLLVTPWTVAHQAPLSMGFSRQEYWSGFPFPTSRDLLDPGMEPVSLPSPSLAGRCTTVPPGKPIYIIPTLQGPKDQACPCLTPQQSHWLSWGSSFPTPSCLEPFLCLLSPLQMPFHLTFTGPPTFWDSGSSSEEASSEVPHLTSQSVAPTWCLCITLLNSLQSNTWYFFWVLICYYWNQYSQSLLVTNFFFFLRTCSTGKTFICNPQVNILSVSTFISGQAQSSNNVGLTKAQLHSWGPTRSCSASMFQVS